MVRTQNWTEFQDIGLWVTCPASPDVIHLDIFSPDLHAKRTCCSLYSYRPIAESNAIGHQIQVNTMQCIRFMCWGKSLLHPGVPQGVPGTKLHGILPWADINRNYNTFFVKSWYVPTWQFWDSGGVKLESLCNFSIVVCQWTVNCLLG